MKIHKCLWRGFSSFLTVRLESIASISLSGSQVKNAEVAQLARAPDSYANMSYDSARNMIYEALRNLEVAGSKPALGIYLDVSIMAVL